MVLESDERWSVFSQSPTVLEKQEKKLNENAVFARKGDQIATKIENIWTAQEEPFEYKFEESDDFFVEIWSDLWIFCETEAKYPKEKVSFYWFCW